MTEANSPSNQQQQIKCPHCGQTYAVRPEQWPQYHGRTINCTRCAQPFTVTAPEGAMPPPGPAAQQHQQQPPQPQGYPGQPAGYPAPGGAYAAQQPAYAYGAAAPYPGQSPPASGWAITSLIFGILGFCVPLGNIVAIITGIVGLTKTRDPRVGGKGMSIAGICLGAVELLVVVPLMIAILLPSLNVAREQANRVKCAANMRQLGMAMTMYANNNNGAFPNKLEDVLTADPTLDRNAFICPDDDKATPSATNAQTAAHEIASGKNCSYLYVGDGLTTSASPDTVLLYEPLALHKRRNPGMNVLFADGRVEWLNEADAKSILDQQAAGTKPIKVTPGP